MIFFINCCSSSVFAVCLSFNPVFDKLPIDPYIINIMDKNNTSIEFLPLMKFRAYKNWRSNTLSVCSSRECLRKKTL